jgi:hypothetical protein
MNVSPSATISIMHSAFARQSDKMEIIVEKQVSLWYHIHIFITLGGNSYVQAYPFFDPGNAGGADGSGLSGCGALPQIGQLLRGH